MKPIIYCLLFLLVAGILKSESPGKKESKLDKNKILLWEGEVTGVYKDKGKVEAVIPLLPEWGGINFKELKAEILKTGKFELRQRVTNKKLGYFLPGSVELEKESEKGGVKQFHVVLRGRFKLAKKSYYDMVSSDFKIGVFRYEDTYLDPSPYYKDQVTGPALTYISAKDKKEMVLVPAGYVLFGQGSAGDEDSYNPAYQKLEFNTLLDIPSFYIDKYEVTNEEYTRYMRETGANPPAYWTSGKVPEGKEHHPVTFLSYKEVEKYAAWAGKRIPTEFEWEKAARGPGFTATLDRELSHKNKSEGYIFKVESIKYPFGNKFEPLFCNTSDSKIGDTISVYDIPTKGASPYGAIGMCGNASEWTSSWYDVYPGHFLKNSAFGKQYKVIRGGSYYEGKKYATSFYRSYGGNPNLSEDRKAGIRLVKDID